MSYKKFLKSVNTVAHLGVVGNSQTSSFSGLYDKYKNDLILEE